MYYSQDNQDKYLQENIFKGYKNGIFVDVGAHDGVDINNTLYFEQNHNWTGINIEPIKRVYDVLVKNRPKCINLDCAICNYNGKTKFISNSGWGERLSGIQDTMDIRHHERLARDRKTHKGETEIVDVNTRRLESILDEHNISHINYLSIDVEGGEYEVIKSINFEKVFIDVIGFENNYEDNSIPIVKYLEEKNFKIINKSLDIFMINNNSEFIKK
tara:strand:- start:271 stop:918 length:648 start_codon:yes stop_codon:yes gene_type:complete